MSQIILILCKKNLDLSLTKVYLYETIESIGHLMRTILIYFFLNSFGSIHNFLRIIILVDIIS